MTTGRVITANSRNNTRLVDEKIVRRPYVGHLSIRVFDYFAGHWATVQARIQAGQRVKHSCIALFASITAKRLHNTQRSSLNTAREPAGVIDLSTDTLWCGARFFTRRNAICSAFSPLRCIVADYETALRVCNGGGRRKWARLGSGGELVQFQT